MQNILTLNKYIDNQGILHQWSLFRLTIYFRFW